MSRVDERIREEMGRLTRPVQTEGLLDSVMRRKRRRRLVRRLEMAAVAAVLGVAVIGGGYGVSRLLAIGEAGRQPGSRPTQAPPPTTDPSTAPPAVAHCDASSVEADLDGDGVSDRVEVYSPAPTCDSDEVGRSYLIRVELAGSVEGSVLEQDLPECDPFACRLLAAPDVNGDGTAEVAIRLVSGASTVLFGLYRFEAGPPEGPAIARLEVTAPGDPWHEEFGVRPGPSSFLLYGSVTHVHTVRCVDEEAGRLLVVSTALRSEGDPDAYALHRTTLRLEEGGMVVAGTSEETISEQDFGTEQVETGPDLCGAPFVAAQP